MSAMFPLYEAADTVIQQTAELNMVQDEAEPEAEKSDGEETEQQITEENTTGDDYTDNVSDLNTVSED